MLRDHLAAMPAQPDVSEGLLKALKDHGEFRHTGHEDIVRPARCPACRAAIAAAEEGAAG